MTDLKALSSRIKESGIPMSVIARRSGILRETLYNRLAGRGEFKASEIESLANVLRLSSRERDDIFFAKRVN